MMNKYKYKKEQDAVRESTMKINMKRGIECFFDVEDMTIRVWGSLWNGREVVEVNDQVVSSKRSFRRSTPHEFLHEGHGYQVIVSTISIMQSRLEIRLYRDGALLDSDQAQPNLFPLNPDTGKIDWRKHALQILALFLGGALIGFLSALVTRGL